MEGFARTGLIAMIAALSLNAPFAGTFALLGGTPKVAAEMTVRHGANGADSIDIFETKDGAKTPILKYDTDMTQLIHFIVVSDDFTHFIHVHPAFNAKTGHFTIDLPLDPSRQYIAYADTEPSGIGQQVFRFLLPARQTAQMAAPAATATDAPATTSTPSALSVDAGPYTVTLGRTTLHANVPQTVTVTVERNGKLATDLRPYLGAAAHAVFVDTATLAYVHVHPMLNGAHRDDMDMAGMDMPMDGEGAMAQAGPEMMTHVPALPAGTYKMWLEFRGGSSLYTAPFTIVVR